MSIYNYVEILKKRYNIKDEEINAKTYLNNSNPHYIVKEMIGMKCIYKYSIFYQLFGYGSKIQEITDKELQMKGIDYIITKSNGEKINIDLKSLVGNYFDEKGFRIPLECITRNDGIIHSTYFMKDGSEKLTDYYLFICHEYSNENIYYCLLSKEYCLNVANNTLAKDLIVAANGHGTYTMHYPKEYSMVQLRKIANKVPKSI